MVLKRSDRASRAKNQRELNKNTERRERSKVDDSKSSKPAEERTQNIGERSKGEEPKSTEPTEE
jgi:hypothetical protein